MANVYQTNVQIGGTIDPSLYNAVGLTAKQMAILQKHIQGFNSLAKQSQASLNGLPPSLQKSNAQISQMNSGFITMGNLIPKLVIGDLISSGIRAGIRAIDEMIGKVHELADEALKVRGQFEESEWALGNILGSRALGAKLQSQLNQLGRNQFGGIKLGEVAQRLSAQGVPTLNLLGTTEMLANIASASGGGEESLNALLAAYMRVHDKGVMEQRGMQQLAHAGVPLEKVLVDLYGKTPYIERNKKGEPTKINESGLASIQAMLKTHAITAKMFDMALIKMVESGGFAADGMKKHANIWKGAVDKIKQEWKLLEDDFGELEERLFTPILNWLNNSGIWDSAHEWISQAKSWAGAAHEWMSQVTSWADGVVNYFKSHDLGKALEPTFDKVQILWAKLNAMFDSQFQTFTNPGTGNVEKYLKPSVVDQLGQVLDKINQTVERIWNLGTALENLNNRLKPLFDAITWIIDKLSKIDDVLYGKVIPFLGKVGGSQLFSSNQGVSIIKERLDSLIKAKAPEAEIEKLRETLRKAEGSSDNSVSIIKERLDALIKAKAPEEEIEKLRETLRKAEDSNKESKNSTDLNTDALNRLSDALTFSTSFNPSMPSLGGNYGLHGPLSDLPGAVYEQYPWEGHAANYGAWHPKEQLRDDGTEVGLGLAKQKQVGARLGDWVRIRFTDGTVMNRQVKETSERNLGVEFFSNQRGKYSRHGRAESVEKIPPPSASENNTNINIHVHAHMLDASDFHRYASDHAETIAHHVKRVFQSDLERSAWA